MNKKTTINFLVSATLVLLSLTTTNLFSQTVGTGIFFQAVARDNFANPAKDRNIYVQSNVIQATPTGVVVLSELHKVTTDATGIFSISIGEGTRIGGTASNLSTIEWSKGPHFLNLKIAITPIAPSTTWDYTKELIDLGVTPFGTVPYALFAGSVAGFDNKLNTVDTAKMLAAYAKVANLNSLVTNKVNIADSTTVYVTPTQLNAKTFDQAPINIAIGTKLNIADSLIKYVTPAQLAAKTFDSSAIYNQLGLKANITDVTSSLGLKANVSDVTTSLGLKADSTDMSTALATKVDKVTGKELSTNDYTTAEKTKLAAVSGTNTGDQDLSSFATSTAVALKENSANKSTANNLGGTSPSDILFPSQKAVKAYVDLLNTSAGVADGSITTAKLADGAVNDIKIAAGISASKVGLGNVNNTSDALKPISAATQAALNDKEAVANKSTSITLDASASSDTKYPSQLSVKTYVDNKFTNQTVGFSNMQTIGANTVLGNATGTTGTITEIATTGTGNIVRGITPTITTPVINGTITGSTIIPVVNGGTGANSLTGFIKGNGIGAFTTVTSIPVADVAGAVKTVNGSTPAADGNVAIAFGSVATGTLAARPVLAGTNGDIYVVSGDATTAENGRTFISNGTTWNEVTANQASTDARYVKLAGSTMAGNLNFPTSTKITITDAPTSSTDVANKLYVDSKVANATPDALTSATGKVQLAGDLSGTANAPTIAAGAVSLSKMASLSAQNKLLGTGATGGLGVAELSLGTGLSFSGSTLNGNIGTVTSLTGTTDRITVTNASTTPTVDIASTYIGQNSITTLGTITSGTWNGSTIALANGGTGATSASGALTNLGGEATANKSTATDMGNTAPSDVLFPSQKAVKTYIDLKSAAAGVADGSITDIKIADVAAGKITGTLAIANGGTGATTASGARTNLGLVIGTNVLAPNAAITAASKTKITYDANGLVTAGTDATTADIAPSTNRNYVTDVQAGVLSNTSGTNTGDQTITLTGDVTGTGTGTFASTLANTTVTAGSYGSSTAIPTFTVDAKGRLTSAGTVGITAGVSALTYSATASYADGGDISGTTLTLSPASILNPGLVSTSAQTFIGAKSFNNQVKVPSILMNNGTAVWELGGGVGSTSLTLYQGGCCGRLTMDDNGRLALGANYAPTTYQFDVDGNGRFTQALTAPEFIGALTGNANTATKLATARTIAITGDISYTSPSFDGSGNVTAAATIGTGVVTNAMLAGSIDVTTKLTGLLPIDHGGTNASTVAGARTSLGLGTAATSSIADFSAPLTFTAPLARAINAISIPAASSSVDGYLSSTDWSTFNNKIDASKRAAINGVASLGADGKIPSSQIPAISFSTVDVVADQTAMLALTGKVAGAIVVNTGASKNYVLNNAASPSTLASWTELATPASISTVNGKSGLSVSIDTDDIGEGTTNKYFSNTLARNAISAAAPLAYNAGTGVVSLGTLPAGNGGTGLTAVGTNGQILTSNGTNMVWSNPSATIGAATNATNLSGGAAGSIPYQTATNVTDFLAVGTNGQVLTLTSGVPSWAPAAVTGITAINGITSGTQTLTVGTTGTAPAFNSSSSTHTLNIPLASATSVTAGLLSKADYDVFNAKQAALTAGTDYQSPITLTTSGNTGAATLISNTINIPNYTLAGLGGIELSGLTANAPLSYNNTTGVFSIPASTSSVNGFLSSTDWTTFNNKFNANVAKLSIGYASGGGTQGDHSIAIGSNAAQSGTQADAAVAIGYAAGQNGQGANSVAIGAFAGNTQGANSIALNASGNVLSPSSSGFYVDPINNAATSSYLFYNTTTKEISYNAIPTLNQNTTGSAATLTTPRNINGIAFDGSADITVGADAGTLSGTTLKSTVTSSSLTGVGTITSGTWNGSTIGVAYGGTGTTSSTGAGSLVLATSPTLVTPILGTPTSVTLTNATGLPIASGVSGLGTGIASFLATPTSSNLLAATTDETGTGALVFANTPTLVSPIIGAATGTSLSLSSTLAAGASTFSSTVNVSGATTLGSTLNVTGSGTFSSTLAAGVTTLASATINGNETVGGTLGVTGATTLSSTLAAGASTFSSTVNVTGATTLGSTLNVTGAGTFSSTLGVTGTTTLTGGVTIPIASKGLGKVLTSDANGVATWQTGLTTITTKTDSYTITNTDNFIIYTTAGVTGKTFALPTAAASGAGKEFTIKNMSGFSLIVTSTSSLMQEYILGGTYPTSINLGTDASNNWIKVISDGTNWIVFRALF